MIRRRLAATALSLCALAVGVSAVPADAQWTSQPSMVGDDHVTVIRGGDTWLNVAWTAPTEMENFRMEVKEWQAGTELAYASDRDGAYLSNDSTLSAGEIDTASFKLTTSSTTPVSFFIQIVAVWEFEGQTYRYFPGGLNVSLVDYNGDQYQLLTPSATVSATGDGAANWVELDFLGLAPMTSDLKVTVTNGPEIYYPQDTFTSLHHDAYLNGGEEDVARFWIDPDLVDPESLNVMVNVEYTNDGTVVTESHPFVLEIV